MNDNSEIGENQSLVDELNSNWSRIPKKYDDFLDLYRPAFNEEEEDEDTQQSTLADEAKKVFYTNMFQRYFKTKF